MEAWSSLRSRLQAVAPEPAVVRPPSLPGQAELRAALALHGVPYKVQMPSGMYCADVALSSCRSNDADVLLLLRRPRRFITNVPSRLLGEVAFRNKMLRRYGTVAIIFYNPDKSSAESMAGDIKAAVEAKTGLPLDSFRS
ncbi:hypothetical protein ABBQ32_000882 [Trebouxia sp. C0010 RCD-2024]